jgi:NADH-quinone oxidoreductase subunit G
MTEIAGVEELGLIGRGEDAEITTYLEKGILSEMSANVVDLCPVGALTHRPWAHNARPWELKKTESIDVMDAVGCAIRVDARGREVLRILPRNNDAVNEEWISDKTRHVADGLKAQRLDRPYIRRGGKLQPVSWPEALDFVAQKLRSDNPARIGAIAGDLAGAEEMFALKDLLMRLGVRNFDCRQDGAKIETKLGRAGYLFNSSIEGIEQADAIMLIGCNPRLEAPVLNARIRKRWRQGGLLVGVAGQQADLGYSYNYLGAGPEALAQFLNHAPAQKERPMFIVGMGAIARPDGAAILAMAAKAALSLGVVRDGWNGFNVLHTAASRVAGLDLGFVPGDGRLDVAGMMDAARRGHLDAVYLLGADEIDMAGLGNAFVIYQGSHGDAGAHRADVILPGATYTEKSATYVNIEGRAQMTARASFPPGEAKEDWAIVRALSAEVGHTLPYDTLPALRAAMYKSAPQLGRLDSVLAADWRSIHELANQQGTLRPEPFVSTVKDFYLTNPIARASAVMAEMSALKAASEGARRLNAAE